MPGGSGGNTRLDPWRAKAFDVSYEKYFDKKGYIALAGFYKKLDTYIYTFSETRDFSQYAAGTNATSNFSQYTTSYNGDGGMLKGAELTVSIPLDLVAVALDGFGMLASTSYTENGIDIKEVNSTIGKIQLPGLSRNVSNVTLYYEKAGFSTRVSGRRRSDYVGEIGNFASDRQLRFVHDAPTVDAQVGYWFNDGRYKGLGVLLQVNNLNNAAYETGANRKDRKDRQLEYAKYGRTVLLGVNYKF